MPQIRPTKFTDFNDQPLNDGYVYVYKVGESYLDSSALLTLTDADTGQAISNPFRTNEYGYPKNSNGAQVNPTFAEEEWAIRVESIQNVEIWTSPKQIADTFNEDVAQKTIVDATFSDLPDAKVANLTAYNTVYVQSVTAGWEGSATGPVDGFYAHKDGTTGTPSTGDENQFFDSAGNGWTRDDNQRIDEDTITTIQSDIVNNSDNISETFATIIPVIQGIDTSSSDGNTVAITDGKCTDSTGALIINVSSGSADIKSPISTTGNMAVTLTADSTFYLFVVTEADGANPRFAFDSSLTAANALTEWSSKTGNTYTLYRLIGFALTDATPDIIAFEHEDDHWFLTTSVQDYSASNPGTTAVLATLDVPTGVSVNPKTWFTLERDAAQTNDTYFLITKTSQTDSTPSISLFTGVIQRLAGGDDGDATSSVNIESVKTDTNAQFRYRLSDSAASVNVTTHTIGWKYKR